MAQIVYVSCALLSISCAYLLFRGYRERKSNLLLWSSLAFSMLALNNMILFVDLVLLPEMDFGGGILRGLTGATGGILLLYGLLWEVT